MMPSSRGNREQVIGVVSHCGAHPFTERLSRPRQPRAQRFMPEQLRYVVSFVADKGLEVVVRFSEVVNGRSGKNDPS
jgi:hypothetical protein